MTNSMKPYIFKSKGLIFLNGLFISLSSLVNILVSYILMYLITIAENKNLEQFKIMLPCIIVYIILLFTFSFLRKYFQAKLIQKTMTNLKQDLFNNILSKNIEDFNNEKSSQYISILTNDLNIIERDYYCNIIEMISSIFSFIVASVLLVNLNIYIALAVIITALITIFVPQLINKHIQIKKLFFSNSLSMFTSTIKDIFSGYEVIKCFNIEDKISSNYYLANKNVEKSKYKLSTLNGLASSLSYTLAMLMFFTTLSVGTYLSIIGSISIGTVIAATQLMNNIANPIVEISNGINTLKSVKSLEHNIWNVINTHNISQCIYNKKTFESNIEFKNVNFAYTNDNYVLKNVSLTLEKGKKYVIVGESGSGKSTLAKLLIKYYQNYKGEILIDNTCARDINTSDLYNLISIIHQNVFIFDGTIKDNITLYNNYDQEKIDEAIELSGLKSTINDLENLVGENGANFSGGEKQRIAIARAIIRKTPIIVLDEATASLDAETSFNIENSILNLNDLTTIVITHKLNKELLNRYDSIIVMKNGSIIEKGDFETLISNKNYFYNLYNIQGLA